MRGNDFLDKMALIDPAYVESADMPPKKKKNIWLKWLSAAACLCIVLGTAAAVHFREDTTDPNKIIPPLSDKTTAKISIGYDLKKPLPFTSYKLVHYTEEEMFSREDMYVFRGRVSSLTNVTIDFNGEKEIRCIATVAIDKVYRGDITEGDEITMLIPCAVGQSEIWVEDTGTVSRLENGMEGIFMPHVYNEQSYMQMNGAVLMLKDLAECGLGDGERWVFLSTDNGLVFADFAYPGAKNAETLDDIEEYVIKMLE